MKKDLNTRKKCYFYTRVSTAVQVEGYSLDAQKKVLEKEAKYRNLKVVGEFSDEGKSGKNIKGRPDFARMLKNIQEGADVDYVLVFKLSRFGRTAADVLESLQLMQDYGVELICVEDGIDSSREAGKLILTVLSAVAEIERENIRVQTMAGREEKARQGKWNGGFAPYGYKLVDGKLEVADDEKEVIEYIFKQYSTGTIGVAGIANLLNRMGFEKKVRQNGTIPRFSANFVKGVIDNPVYIGKIAYGRRRTEKIEGKRNEYHVVKQDEYQVYDAPHTPLVDEQTWNICQKFRTENGIKREKTHSLEHEHILSSILRCPVCDAPMYGNVNRKKKKDGSGEYYKDSFFYVCKHRKLVDGRECSYRKQPSQDRVNAEVEAIVKEAFRSPTFHQALDESFGQYNDQEKQLQHINELKKELKRLTVLKDKLNSDMLALDVDDELFDQRYSDMQEQINKLYNDMNTTQKNIDEEEALMERTDYLERSRKNVKKYIDKFIKDYDSYPDAKKKELMKGVLDRVELFEEAQEDGRLVKMVRFKYPLIYKGVETQEVWWDREKHGETVCLLTRE